LCSFIAIVEYREYVGKEREMRMEKAGSTELIGQILGFSKPIKIVHSADYRLGGVTMS
jgi:hypothetical protein